MEYLNHLRDVCFDLRRFEIWLVSGILALVCVVGYQYTFSSPHTFVPGTIVTIVHGAGVSDITSELATAHVIRHPRILQIILRLTNGSTTIQTGTYQFATAQNVFTIAHRLTKGEYGMSTIRITFVEGATTREISEQIAQAFPTLSAEAFLRVAKSQEGYLFPDTYFFHSSDTAESVVKTMRSNFDTKIATLSNALSTSGHSLADTVTMASLVEKEGRTTETRRMIAGILWNRLAKGMPLQVDAVFGYINNRPTYSPSYSDLKIDSPYNTYLHTGLPPGPINNPGLDALSAVLNPTTTSYLFYLTDRNGVMHYATTYTGHIQNQRTYFQ